MSSERNLRGEGTIAEDAAAEYLLEQGFTIVTRRWKTRRGELDLIALEGELLVFVEVKYRLAPGYRPEDSVGTEKRSALYRAGQAYLHEIGEPERACRFDLIAMDAEGIRHYREFM